VRWVLWVPKVFKEQLDQQALKALLALLELLALLVQKVRLDQQVLQDFRENWGQLALRVFKVFKVFRVRLDQQVRLDRKDLLVTQALLAHWAIQDLQVRKVTLVLLVLKEKQGQQARKETQEK
jgi:hypothetical protein